LFLQLPTLNAATPELVVHESVIFLDGNCFGSFATVSDTGREPGTPCWSAHLKHKKISCGAAFFVVQGYDILCLIDHAGTRPEGQEPWQF
jgi:hypothetical protein